ncbi:hypothetical protein SKAU_G00384990 [Synaphobranchus kaupii]|uniref:Zona pellucida sperm-binding protein 3 n=1 Tax=Synaphobranchus kaupii TaxID=118154 RepID=A0A9Q1EED4_SYNKA|nr:hypothetical protein SKAU_G00384990 [Synaphobranchus kaupii]
MKYATKKNRKTNTHFSPPSPKSPVCSGGKPITASNSSASQPSSSDGETKSISKSGKSCSEVAASTSKRFARGISTAADLGTLGLTPTLDAARFRTEVFFINFGAPVTPRPTRWIPGITRAPVTPRQTRWIPGITQAPVTSRTTHKIPGSTWAPVTPRPTRWIPGFTRAPVTPRPTRWIPGITKAPVTPRPTRWIPGITQAPVTPRPTRWIPGITQAPVTPRPTRWIPGITRAPVMPRPTRWIPGITQAPVTPRPTHKIPGFTQAPVTPRPTQKEPTIVVETPTPKPNAVKVHCGESSVQFEVDMDLLGIGHLIQPSDINLGGCGPVGQHGSEVLLFETELHGCGSVLAMMEDALVYTFALNYQPNSFVATPIIRTSSAVVGLQCHYMRLHNVSSNALKPTWIPYHSTLSAEELLVFSMRLMADHWQLERGSNVFFLGDLINIEVSVVQANHMPLRVFVDTCVATLDPDMNAVPRYAFIENDGCLMDSKLTNSRSQLLSRVQDDKLQFQLDAFRWISASGNDQACSCCDTSCVVRKGRSVDSGAQYAGTAVLGPIVVQEAAKDVPESHSRVKADDRAEGPSEAMIIAGVMAAVGFVCMIVLGTLLVQRRYKPLV